jgi:hypothetical protein
MQLLVAVSDLGSTVCQKNWRGGYLFADGLRTWTG